MRLIRTSQIEELQEFVLALMSTNQTTTRIKGGASGSLVGGDVSLLAGSNISITQSGNNITIANSYSYTLPTATTSTLGGVKLGSDTVQSVAAVATPASTASRSYPIQLDSGGKMVVNVPWTDNNTNTTYTAGTGLTLTGTAFSVNYGTTSGTAAAGNDSRFHNAVTIGTNANGLSLDGQVLSLALATTSAAGAMSGADKTKLDGLSNYSLPTATSSVLGGVKLFSNTVQTVAAATTPTTAASRTYGIQVNNSGQMVVNVPWTDTQPTAIPQEMSFEMTVAATHIVSGVVTITLTTARYGTSGHVFLNGVKIPRSKITFQSATVLKITNSALATPIIVGDFIEVEYTKI